MTKDQILFEAMTLDPCERDEVAEALWKSIVPGELAPAQIAEAQGRIEKADSDQAQPVPGEDAGQELRRRFQH